MDSQEPRDANAASDAGKAARASRRRFVRGGLAGAPVLLSVVSRPALAASVTCKPGSAFSSANLSRPNNSDAQCSGCRPSWWALPANIASWPNGVAAQRFDAIFSPGGIYAANTMLEVVRLTSGAGFELAKHVAAAYLNAVTNRTPPLVCSDFIAKDIWSKVATQGYWAPTAGVKWYPGYSEPASTTGGVIAWLQTTMPNS